MTGGHDYSFLITELPSQFILFAKWGISREQFKKDIESGLTEGNWKRNEVGWWWEESDGSYPKSQWKNIKGEWFYFDNRGYCFINKWFNDGKDWFYLDKRGAMVTGWMHIDHRWYYFKSDGRMAKGWVKYRETWYYLDEKDGDMKSKQFIKSGNGWYYLKSDGSLSVKPEFTIEPDGLITTN